MVHQWLDTFELRMLARSSPLVDVSTLQDPEESIRTDIEARFPECEAASAEPAEDTVMAALFCTSEILPPPS